MSATDVMALVRPDLRAFAGYRSARSESLRGDVWLNANESPWANPADLPSATAGGVRRYPDPQPAALRQALAKLYDVAPGQLLAGRGSDEAIDLLVRALCPPGGGAIVITTPTFGMYAVSARLHGVRVVDVPLQETGSDGAYECDFDAVAREAEATGARLVFLCSPGNPTGARCRWRRSTRWLRASNRRPWWSWMRPTASSRRRLRRRRCWPDAGILPSCGRCPRRMRWRPPASVQSSPRLR